MSKVEYYKNILKEAMKTTEAEKISNKEYSLQLAKRLNDKGYETKPLSSNTVIKVIVGRSVSRTKTLQTIANDFGGMYRPDFTSNSSIGEVQFTNGTGRNNTIHVVVKSVSKGGESSYDDIREVSVCVALAALIEGCRDDHQITKFIDELPTSKVERLVVGGSVKTVDVKNEMLDDPALYRNSVGGAKALIDKFGLSNLKKYSIHHKSSLVEKIRTNGARLARLRGSGSADKWNPSDFYLIHNGVDVDSHTESLEDYNSFIGNDDNVIGISHKKGEEEANHGKAAVDEMLRRLGGTPYNMKFSSFDEHYTKELIRNIKRIKQGGSDKIVFLVPHDVETVSATVQANADTEGLSANYKKGIPAMIDMIADFNTNEKLDSLVDIAYRYAKSEMTFSCNHYKLMGDKLVHINGQVEHDIKLQRVYIPLVKETQVVFKMIVDGEPVKLQCRSFGSKPQFEVKAKQEYTNKKYKELKLVDVDQNFLK